MNILFLIFSEINQTTGISKKIQAQVRALESLDAKVRLCHYKYIDDNRYWAINNDPIAKIGKGPIAYWRYLAFYGPVLKHIKNNNYDCIYIRYVHNANPYLISFLKRLKELNKTIFLEIPTFPYDGEYKNIPIYFKPVIYFEHRSRNEFKKYIDRIITFSNHETIFDVPTIKLSNAVDPRNIQVRKIRSSTSSINFIGVANLMFWHGFDRLINAIYEYYQSDYELKVYFNIVGFGPEMKNLKDLVNRLGLHEYIRFTGPLTGKELDNLFNQCDIGVGCLGCHRKNITEVKSLKNVEYATRGIPFIYAEQNDDFDDKSYIFKIEPNETAISIKQILNWYLSHLNLTPDAIRSSVKELTWEFQMLKIVNFYKRGSYK